MIELLTLMLTAYQETKKILPRTWDQRRRYYILELNRPGVLSMAQIAVCCNTSRDQVKKTIDKARVPKPTNTVRGLINPEGLEIILIAAKHIHLGQDLPDHIRIPLAWRCGGQAIIARLVGLSLLDFRRLQREVKRDALAQ